MLSLSGHKFHAPKGIGALYIRKGVKISNLIFAARRSAVCARARKTCPVSWAWEPPLSWPSPSCPNIPAA